MAQYQLSLPKDSTKLARVLKQHADREWQASAYWRVMAMLVVDYLNGARRFDLFDVKRGLISSRTIDNDGKLEFQSTELLRSNDEVAARLASGNFSPSVLRTGSSLMDIQNRSRMQVGLDSVINPNQLDKTKRTFGFLMSLLGSCGIIGHLTDLPTVGMVGDLEVVHPVEILPWPSWDRDPTKNRGYVRYHWVPIGYLKAHKDIARGKITKDFQKLEAWRVLPGGATQRWDTTNAMTASDKLSATVDTAGEYDTYVRIIELWQFGPQETVTRYVMTSGDTTLIDHDLSKFEVYCPLGFGRFFDTGNFHGAGMVHLMYSLCRELERNMKALFQNTRDMDQYGMVILPQGMVNKNDLLRDIGRGLRAIFYEPDSFETNFNPMYLQPFNSRDTPGKVAAFAKQVKDQLSPVQDLIQEKGRMDSAVGMAALDEQIDRAMTNPTNGVATAWGDMYRSLGSRVMQRIREGGEEAVIPLTKLSLDIVGAGVDVERGVIRLYPTATGVAPSTLRFTIKDTAPKSTATRKSEAIGLLREQALQIDKDEFCLFALDEGLDFAMWMEDRKAAYESVLLNIISLYNDGQSPGQIWETQHTVRPEFQIRVLDGFLASIYMKVASPEVVDEFTNYRLSLIDWMGLSLPEAVPNPDDFAVLREAENQAAEIMARNQPQPQMPQLPAGAGQGATQ